MTATTQWFRVLDLDELPEGRVTTVTAGHKSIAMTDYLGKISKEQKAGEWDVWQTSLHNPNFAKYAEICGGFGIRVTQKAELDRAIQQALAYKGAALVEVMSDSALI